MTVLSFEPKHFILASSLLAALTVTISGQAQTTPHENYRQAIEEVEEHFGPYDSQLPQHLTSLGLSYQQQGEHAQAVEIFERALHIQRIGGGLYDLNQVPILEEIIESNVARGRWDEASNNHQYLYWLHRRNYDENDPRMLPVIDKLSHWHLNSYSVTSSSGLAYHLINAHQLFTNAVSIISTHYGDNDLRMVDALRGLTASNYYLATYNASQQFSAASYTPDDNQNPASRVLLGQYIMNSYRSGRDAITRMRDIYSNSPEAPPAAEIGAQIELADWNMLFDRSNTAIAMYQQAYNDLVTYEDHAALTKDYFGEPKALPNLPLFKGNLNTVNEDVDYVLVNFSVSEHGRAKNIKIIESFPENNVRNRIRVRQSLKAAKFRPRFDNGSPVTTEEITHRYVFP